MNDDENRRCPLPGYPYPYRKEDCWIVWICNKDGLIMDIEIYVRLKDDEFQWDRVTRRVDELLKGRYFDCGNCNSHWHNVTLQNLFFKFFYEYGFVSEKVKLKCLKRLGIIEEFQEDIKKYLDYIGEEIEPI